MTLDALVVGAGPAGSVAALCLARAGLRVRILERSAFPREKLCGDTLNPGSLALLDRLGVGPAVRAASVPVRGMRVTGPGGAAVSADYDGGLAGAALPRACLDRLLLEAAVAAGAEFEPSTSVVAPRLGPHGRADGLTVRRGTRDSRLDARIVVAADGRTSRVGAALGLTRFAARPRRWAFGAYYRDVAGVTAHGEMHVRPGGYIGVAPLPGGLANVCVVRAEGEARAGARGAGGLRHLLESAVRQDPWLRDRFDRATAVTPLSVLGPLAVESTACGCPGLLLAGDAAGFVDPMTGDGLRFAIRGGELAAEAACRELATGLPAYGELQRARRTEFAGKWRLNRALRALVSSPSAVHGAAVVASRWSTPVRALIHLAGDVHLAAARPAPLEPARQGGA